MGRNNIPLIYDKTIHDYVESESPSQICRAAWPFSLLEPSLLYGHLFVWSSVNGCPSYMLIFMASLSNFLLNAFAALADLATTEPYVQGLHDALILELKENRKDSITIVSSVRVESSAGMYLSACTMIIQSKCVAK